MPVVDRNIIRLALFELRLGKTPVGVVVSEAVNMAKRFSTERSGAFVNGVLAKLIEDPDAEGPGSEAGGDVGTGHLRDR